MNEEYNPYNNPAEPVANPADYMQQQPVQAPVQPPQPPAQQPPTPQQQFGNNYPQGYTYPPQFTNGNRPYYTTPNTAPKNGSGAANVFGIVSFIIGCFAILITSMIYFNFRSSVSEKFGFATVWSCVVGLPALVFGVVSLMKKTDKKIFAILGISFAAVLMLCAFITYFVMVNTVSGRGYYY